MRQRLQQRGTVSLVISAGALVAVAACGSSGSVKTTGSSPAKGAAGTSSSPGGAAATGAIRIMSIAPSGTSTANFADVPVVLKAYVDALDKRGGINGHQVSVDYCNDKNDPNLAAGCARTAISNKDIAVVGEFSTSGDQVITPLSAAGIADLGNNGTGPKDLSDPDSFPIQPGPTGVSALAAAAAQSCKTVDFVTYDIASASALAPVLAAGFTAVHHTLNKTVKIPPTATDYTSYVAATKDADCVITAIPDQAEVIYLGTAKGLGVKQRLFGFEGTLGSNALKAAPAQLEGSVLYSPFPVSTAPVWAPLKAALAADGKNDVDLTIPENLNAWVSGVVFEQVAKTLTSYDAASFRKALSAAAAVDTGGLTPTLDFAKPFPVPAIARAINTSVTVQVVKDGAFVQQGGFIDTAAGSH